MAVKTDVWVSAHLRRCFAAGLFGVVARKGAAEAGAVYVRILRPDGTFVLLAPAPGPAYSDDGVRRWRVAAGAEEGADAAEALLQREMRRDPDIWIIDIEDREGLGLLDEGLET